MSLMPTMLERIARARVDLRMGLPVVLTSANSAILAISVESLTPARLGDLRDLGPVALALTARRATTLKARAYDGDLARIKVPGDVDLAWVQALADPSDDLEQPMKGPLTSLREGDASLARLAIALVKSARLLPAALYIDLPEAGAFALKHDLTLLPQSSAEPLLNTSSPLHPVAAARLPMEASEAYRLHIFRPEDGGEEHYAIEVGRPDRSKPVLARLHSACFTGDVLGSLKCDCGPQLRGALGQMGQEGSKRSALPQPRGARHWSGQ